MTERDIFIAALQRDDPAARQVCLDEACGSDAALRARVEELLAVHDRAASFLESPPASPVVTADLPTAEEPGTVIGPYKLLEQIGEGGFGVVYMAEQAAPVRRKVALKVLKPGMDTRQVVARFEAERQALALMDHPNIARVFDGGQTPSGRPYFVMELVRGVPITEFCDRSHLTLQQRLELFVSVCRAIQHAHQKGIIHRDLKPSNILVTVHDTAPMVKVIDFGIAKALGQELTDKTLFTAFAQMVGTPLYMSPEQAGQSGLDVDTRSDIYSLGVLLYELLTGTTPFTADRLKRAAYEEIRRIIREEEPPRPSTRLSESRDTLPSISAQRQTEPARLTKLVRGELDWIVMKALEKDRGRRYETASGFAQDIERYLADEPVLACPPSAGYRLRKFARRNRRSLATATVLAVAVLVAVGGIGWAVRDRAVRRAKVVGQVESILDEVERLEREQKWPEALAAVGRAEAALGGEADDTVRQRVGDVQRDLDFITRLDRIRQSRAATVDGNFNNAGPSRDYARAFREYGLDVEAGPPEEAIARLVARPALAAAVAGGLDHWASLGRMSGEAEEVWRPRVVLARRLDPDSLRDRLRSMWGQAVSPDRQAALKQLADSLDVRAASPATIGLLIDTLTAAGLADAGLRVLRAGQSAHPGDFWLNFDLGVKLGWKDPVGAAQYSRAAVSLRPDSATAHGNLGVYLLNLREWDEAAACFRRALELDPTDAVNHSNLGSALRAQGRPDEAAAHCRRAIELDPNNAVAHINLGLALKAVGKLDEAVACFHRAVELNPNRARVHHYLGVALGEQGKLDAAAVCFRKAIELNPKAELVHSDFATALRRAGKNDEALAVLQRAVELIPNSAILQSELQGILGLRLVDAGKLDDAIICFRREVHLAPENAAAYERLGHALADKGLLDEAVATLRKAIELDSKSAGAHDNLGAALFKQGKTDEAMAAFRRAVELDPRLATARRNLGLLLLDRKQVDEAIDSLGKAVELDPKSADNHADLAQAYAAKGDADHALASWQKAVELEPRNPQFLALLAETLYKLGRNGEALGVCRRAVKSVKPGHPSYADAHGLLGVLLAADGQVADALAAYRTALGADPNRADVMNNLAWQLANCRDSKLRDPSEAVRLAKKAVELAPAEGNWWNTLGAAFFRAGNWKESVVALEKSITLRKGGDANDWFILAMAHHRLGHPAEARKWFEKAVEWTAKNAPKDSELARFRAEAAGLLCPPPGRLTIPPRPMPGE